MQPDVALSSSVAAEILVIALVGIELAPAWTRLVQQAERADSSSTSVSPVGTVSQVIEPSVPSWQLVN